MCLPVCVLQIQYGGDRFFKKLKPRVNDNTRVKIETLSSKGDRTHNQATINCNGQFICRGPHTSCYPVDGRIIEFK